MLVGGVWLAGCAATDQETGPGQDALAATQAAPSANGAAATSSGLESAEVVSREATFTQGMELLEDGTLVHSRGLYGQSGLDVLSATGEVLRSVELPADEFGEGVTVVPNGYDDPSMGPVAYQLTWQSGVVHTWSVPDLVEGPPLEIDSEGWGLCYDESRDVLWLSDGTPTLRSLAVKDLEVLSEVDVGEVGVDGERQPVMNLNELECVDGQVWANVWLQDDIVQIDPATGVVDQRLDLAQTVAQEGNSDPDSVLNGIAYDDRDGSFLITGKNWSQIYRVDLAAD